MPWLQGNRLTWTQQTTNYKIFLSIPFHFILISGNSNTGQRPQNMEHVNNIHIKLSSVKTAEYVKMVTYNRYNTVIKSRFNR
jgi:hypothetical protein